MSLKRDSAGAVRWDDNDVPAGFAGSWHAGEGVWRSRCRGCGLTYDETGPNPLPRYAGIGRHEYESHGLSVPGINVGLLT